MFTITCDTCEAKLIVKDEKLIGKILACPKCGSMVLVQPPDDASAPSESQKKVVRKKFPDALSHETGSGIIGEVSPESRRSNLLMETITPDTDVSETEIKTRKILLGILIILTVFLLIVFGILMMYRETPEPLNEIPPEPPLHIPVEPAEPVIDPPPEVEPEIEPPDIPPPIIPPPDIPDEPAPDNGEPVIVPNEDHADTDIEVKMIPPRFVDAPLPEIDIDAKLALPILELHFEQQRLIGFVRNMSQITGVPMTLDIDEMKPLSLSARTAVSGQFSETTAGEILTETLATLNLQWIAADNQILIFPNEPDNEPDLTFDVSDLVESAGGLTPEVLADMIRKLVVPDKNVEILPDNRLSVVQNEHANGRSLRRQRDEVLRLLEQLRFIRQLPQQTELMAEDIAPEAFGWDRVIEPVTFNHYWAVPLPRAVGQLESLTELTILVDHQSLHRSFCTFASVSATVQCDHGTVNEAMELLLASADSAALAYRIVDHQTLEITTAEAVRQPEKMVMEVHPYQLSAGETPEEIVRLLRLSIAPESWAVAELPGTKLGGNIVIDVPSNCLLIRQSQPVQRQIRLYLSESALLEP